jgi:hypothetical protein
VKVRDEYQSAIGGLLLWIIITLLIGAGVGLGLLIGWLWGMA